MARHKYTIQYSPVELGANGPPPSDEADIEHVLSKSLLERAGLQRKPESNNYRYNPFDDAAGQMKKKREYE
jgi:hypothetical protein